MQTPIEKLDLTGGTKTVDRTSNCEVMIFTDREDGLQRIVTLPNGFMRIYSDRNETWQYLPNHQISIITKTRQQDKTFIEESRSYRKKPDGTLLDISDGILELDVDKQLVSFGLDHPDGLESIEYDYDGKFLKTEMRHFKDRIEKWEFGEDNNQVSITTRSSNSIINTATTKIYQIQTDGRMQQIHEIQKSNTVNNGMNQAVTHQVTRNDSGEIASKEESFSDPKKKEKYSIFTNNKGTPLRRINYRLNSETRSETKKEEIIYQADGKTPKEKIIYQIDGTKPKGRIYYETDGTEKFGVKYGPDGKTIVKKIPHRDGSSEVIRYSIPFGKTEREKIDLKVYLSPDGKPYDYAIAAKNSAELVEYQRLIIPKERGASRPAELLSRTLTHFEVFIRGMPEGDESAPNPTRENLDGFLKNSQIREVSKLLVELNQDLDSFPSENEKGAKIESLNAKLAILKTTIDKFINELETQYIDHDAFSEEAIAQLRTKIEASRAQLEQAIAGLNKKIDENKKKDPKQRKESPLSTFYSSQSRDIAHEYILSDLIRDHSMAIAEIMATVTASSKMNNTRFVDAIALQKGPRMWMETARQINEFTALAYMRHHGTHYHEDKATEPLELKENQRAWVHFGESLNSLSGIEVIHYVHALLGKPMPEKSERELSQKPYSVLDFLADSTTFVFIKPFDFCVDSATKNYLAVKVDSETISDPPNKRLSLLKLSGAVLGIFLLGAIVVGPGRLIGYLAKNFIVPVLAYVADIVFTLPRMAVNAAFGLELVSFLTAYNEFLYKRDMAKLNTSEELQEFAQENIKGHDINLAMTAGSGLQMAGQYLYGLGKYLTEQSIPDLKLAEVEDIFDHINVKISNQSVQISGESDPALSLENEVAGYLKLAKTSEEIDVFPEAVREQIFTGNMSMEIVHSIVDGLSDEIIASMRDNYPLLSSLGFMTSLATFGLNAVVPAAFVAKMGLAKVAHDLLIPTIGIGKHFLGHAALASDPGNLFFSLLMQWKFGNMAGELGNELFSGDTAYGTYVREHFKEAVTILVVGSIAGYGIGFLPVADSPLLGAYNFIVDEAHGAQNADWGLNAIAYTFLAGKVSYLIISQFTDQSPHLKLDANDPKDLIIIQEMRLAIAEYAKKVLEKPESKLEACSAFIQKYEELRKEQLGDAAYQPLPETERERLIEALDVNKTQLEEANQIIQKVAAAEEFQNLLNQMADPKDPLDLRRRLTKDNITYFKDIYEQNKSLIESSPNLKSQFFKVANLMTENQYQYDHFKNHNKGEDMTFEKSLDLMKTESFDKEMQALSRNDRIQYFKTLIKKTNDYCDSNGIDAGVRDELLKAFYDRHIRDDPPALFRIPVRVYQITKYYITQSIDDKSAFIHKHEYDEAHERAFDRIQKDSWSGDMRRMGRNFVDMTKQAFYYTYHFAAVITVAIPLLYTAYWLLEDGKSDPFKGFSALVNAPLHPIQMLGAMTKAVLTKEQFDQMSTFIGKGKDWIQSTMGAVKDLFKKRTVDTEMGNKIVELYDKADTDLLRQGKSYPSTGAAVHRAEKNMDLASAVALMKKHIAAGPVPIDSTAKIDLILRNQNSATHSQNRQTLSVDNNTADKDVSLVLSENTRQDSTKSSIYENGSEEEEDDDDDDNDNDPKAGM